MTKEIYIVWEDGDENPVCITTTFEAAKREAHELMAFRLKDLGDDASELTTRDKNMWMWCEKFALRGDVFDSCGNDDLALFSE